MISFSKKRVRAKLDPPNDSIKICQLLCWIAGAEINPAGSEIDEEKLGDLIIKHRLTGRFIERWQQEHPRWCNKFMMLRMLEQRAQEQIQVQRQLKAVQEISAALASTGSPLIVFKGFTTYALTGNRAAIRYSSDMDLFFSDLELLWQTLHTLGYQGKKEDIHTHEFARLSRHDLLLEMHRFCVVISFREGLMTEDHLPIHNSGIWKQQFALSGMASMKAFIKSAHIHYEDLQENSSCGITHDTQGLFVANPTMAAFILCAHVLRHYQEPVWENLMPIKLGELAEIRDLAHDPDFNKHLFFQIVEKFSGHQSIKFAGDLLEAIFGENPFCDSTTSLTSASETSLQKIIPYPRTLSWFGCWASVYSVGDLLVSPSPSLLINRLGTSTIVARTNGSSQTYTYPEQGVGKPLERVITQFAKKAPFPLRVCVNWMAQGLFFDISVMCALQNNYVVSILSNYPDFRHSSIVMAESTELIVEEGTKTASLHLSDTSFTLRVLLPWADVPESLCKSHSHLLLLTIVDAAECIDAPAPVMIVPLTVVRG